MPPPEKIAGAHPGICWPEDCVHPNLEKINQLLGRDPRQSADTGGFQKCSFFLLKQFRWKTESSAADKWHRIVLN